MRKKKINKNKPMIVKAITITEKQHALLWEKLKTKILNSGRPKTDQRKSFAGIVHLLTSKTSWNNLPKEYGPKSTVFDTKQRWEREGILKELIELIKQIKE